MGEATQNAARSELAAMKIQILGGSGMLGHQLWKHRLAAHFHGPAAAGANAPPVVPVPATALASPIKGDATLTDAQAADLAAGKWYFNIHTAAHGPGEIRGQVEKK